MVVGGGVILVGKSGVGGDYGILCVFVVCLCGVGEKCVFWSVDFVVVVVFVVWEFVVDVEFVGFGDGEVGYLFFLFFVRVCGLVCF